MFLLFLFLLTLRVQSEEWDAFTFPNPTLDQFRACGMKSRARICDPDSVLSEAGRIRLDEDLKELEDKTQQENGLTFCDRKGLTAVLAIARHVSNGTAESVKEMATHMLHKWKVDSKCKKSMLILISIDDMKFWAEKDEKVPIWSTNFTDFFEEQKPLFHKSDYQGAVSHVLKHTSRVVETQWKRPNDFNGRLTPITQEPDLHDPRFGNYKDLSVPSIPGWFWAALLFAIVPITCCCLCSYLCCCGTKDEQPSEHYPENMSTRKSRMNAIFGNKNSSKAKQSASAAYDFDHGYSENRAAGYLSTSYSSHPNRGVYSSNLHHGGGGSWA